MASDGYCLHGMTAHLFRPSIARHRELGELDAIDAADIERHHSVPSGLLPRANTSTPQSTQS